MPLVRSPGDNEREANCKRRVEEGTYGLLRVDFQQLELHA
jgi:hypothetical protein